ncbi:hypothetical protein Bca4012_096365 [Brassica carinata]|uniref:Uncharacterized protein n=2 Tax=Brassica oleracea TaxID=3712 RepID=A0A0D3DWC0_BRAOL|nr:unnamed protein product [Brassica oleracea]
MVQSQEPSSLMFPSSFSHPSLHLVFFFFFKLCTLKVLSSSYFCGFCIYPSLFLLFSPLITYFDWMSTTFLFINVYNEIYS